ncbi:hypothetical protein D3C85_1081340 [compost metagenome]
MKEFEITSGGYYRDGVRVEIGTRIRAESLPAELVNKAVEVAVAEKELTLEVATPRRGRPPKE